MSDNFYLFIVLAVPIIFLLCFYFNYVDSQIMMKKKKKMSRTDIPEKWRLLLNENDINFCVDKCAKHINEIFKGKNVVVVCILKGAAYFFVDLTRKLTIPHSCYFIESSSYHDSQVQSECNIMGSIEPSKFKNKHVVLVDELFDNGETMHEMKQAINEKGEVPMNMIFTCTAFKKDKQTWYDAPNLFGITIPNVWVVGYGLDYQQEKRNWTDLWACPKDENITKTTDDQMFDDLEFYDRIRSKLILVR